MCGEAIGRIFGAKAEPTVQAQVSAGPAARAATSAPRVREDTGAEIKKVAGGVGIEDAMLFGGGVDKKKKRLGVPGLGL